MSQATTVGDEDPDHAGGSYVVVQKYLHDLSRWNRLPVPSQEGVIGRTKVENIELPDAEHGQKSHKTLATIVDEAGVEHEILRDNMPFGRPGHGEFGTYFIGYSRALVGDRADAGAHVRRRSGGQLRPHPRLLDGRDRVDVLRADTVVPGVARRLSGPA